MSTLSPANSGMLRDSVLFITGGSSGIGLGIALAAAERGARVGLIGTSTQKLDKAQMLLRERAAECAAVVLDVANATAWPAAVAELTARIGPPDTLVLNAGIGTEATLADCTPEAVWRWTFDVNVMGTVNGLSNCLPGMRSRARPGHVLITSSIGALITPRGLGPYATTKAAIIALAETLRIELAGTKIRPSVLIPAAVRTDFSATSARHAPPEWSAEQRTQALENVRRMLNTGLDPLDVGRYALEAMCRGDFYIFSHPDFREVIAARQAEMLAAIPLEPLTPPPGSGG